MFITAFIWFYKQVLQKAAPLMSDPVSVREKYWRDDREVTFLPKEDC